MNQDKTSLNFQPLIVMFLGFLVIIFSINQIINMARPVSHATVPITLGNITQNQQQLSYKGLQAKFSAPYPQAAFSSTTFGIKPQVAELAVNKQGDLIRFKLIEGQLENIQKQLNEISAVSKNDSLIFKLGFWIYTLFIWIGSIFCGRILMHYTDKFIKKYC